MLSEKTTVWASSGAVLAFALGLSSTTRTAAHGSAAKPPVAKPPPVLASAEGATVFAQRCAGCHGTHGEGIQSKYPHALTGSQSAGQLATYIAENMPPDGKRLPKGDAQAVAAYVYDAFYGPIAQERNRPARVALSRLTVRQMRNALCDLVGSFRYAEPKIETGRGLKAEYFKARNFGDGDRILQRVDSTVNFDFGKSGPSVGTSGAAAFDPYQFSIRWSGSVAPPDEGDYEFVVHSSHAIRLWVDDPNKPVIDASIRSGNETTYRATVHLLGGRVYPLRLEFSKSTTGVDDTAQEKGKPIAPASVELAWVPPHQVEEPIPTRCLLPQASPEVFVLTTPFPPDDRSRGYDRGDSVSKAWDDATIAAAFETADYVVAHLNDLAGTRDDPARLRAFAKSFAERALRRPLDPTTENQFVGQPFAVAPNAPAAVKRVVLRTLLSPRFLYREVGAPTVDVASKGATDPYAVAARLSFALWDSLPDNALRQAAASGNLATPAQVQAQAVRMATDRRAWAKQRAFFLQWLKVDQYPDLAKDPKRFPDFTPQVAEDLRTSLDLTLEHAVDSDSSDFRDLLLSDKVYLNGRLAKLYSVPPATIAPDADFQLVALDPTVRAGILTHPYLLASLSYFATSDPIHRGVLLTRNILGRTLNPPPAAFVPLAASLHPDLTTRQRVALQTKPATCQSCHAIINPLGFTLERFDAIGRLRTAENGHPIDATGSYAPANGTVARFTGAGDLARYLANSDDSHRAFVQKLFQFTVNQPIRAYGPMALQDLNQSFARSGYNIRDLTATIAARSALPLTAVPSTTPTPSSTRVSTVSPQKVSLR